jgi:hypothetical protein
MLWLAIVIFLALAIAVLRGGRLVNLGDIELRAWWLLFIALGLQLGTGFLPDQEWSEWVGLTMVLVSFGLLMILVMLNRSKPGMWIAGIGVLMNFVVIAANGGMPVLAGAAEVASGFTVSEPDLSGNLQARSVGRVVTTHLLRRRHPAQTCRDWRGDQSRGHLPRARSRGLSRARAASAPPLLQARRPGAARLGKSSLIDRCRVGPFL